MKVNVSMSSRAKIKCFPLSSRFAGGFTITELVLALAITMVIILAMVSLLISLNRTFVVQNVTAGVQQVTRSGINIMTRSIRMAGFNPLKVNRIGILQASADKIRFQQDTNGSGKIEIGKDEDIAYLLNDNHQLIRQKDGNSRSNRSIVDQVHALEFKYFNRENEETNILDDIHSIEISLTIREPVGKEETISRTYCTRVICRNLSV
jgi:type II secretory pathway component PulJ